MVKCRHRVPSSRSIDPLPFLAGCFVAVIVLGRAGAAFAESAVLQAVADNTLYESATGALSNGAGPTMFAGRTSQPAESRRRALVAFDVAGAIPPGSRVTSAILTLSMSQTSPGDRTVALHLALASWGEGASDAGPSGGGGAPATPNDATWIHRFWESVFWSVPGGDFVATPSATAPIGGVGMYSWGSAQMAADAQSWLDSPATSFGWLLLGDESAVGSAKRFDTREHPDPSNRPTLTIEYSPPPNAASDESWGGVKARFHTNR
jgi:hypothetical protein